MITNATLLIILLLPSRTSLGLLMCQPAFGGLRIPLLATNSRASPISVLVGLFDVFILVVASVHFVFADFGRILVVLVFSFPLGRGSFLSSRKSSTIL